jgi:hypothetical protein
MCGNVMLSTQLRTSTFIIFVTKKPIFFSVAVREVLMYVYLHYYLQKHKDALKNQSPGDFAVGNAQTNVPIM